jgi:hypothetical protein
LEAHEGKADLDALDQMLAPDFVSHIKRLPGNSPTAKATSGRSPSILQPFPIASSSSRSR